MNSFSIQRSQKISLSDLLDIQVFQDLFDSFSKLIGLSTAILDIDGNILVSSGWRRICTQFHRKNLVTASKCLESDTILANQLKKGKKNNIYQCRNGLIDVATPIIIENVHFGNLFAGQFLFEKPDLEFFSRQAETYGFNKLEYLAALENVPVFSRRQIKKTMSYLSDLTIVIGSAGMDKKKSLELNRALEKKIHERTIKLEMEKTFSESLVSSLPGVMYVFDETGRFKRWNRNFEKITGYSSEQISEMTPLDFIAPKDKSRVKKIINQVFEEGTATVEAGFSTISGTIIPFLFTGFKYIQQDINYLIGVGLDISERVKTENEKAGLIKQLQATLSEVKHLSGLLPICSSCKKIRDDKGYWNQIELYIDQHSEAKFSHGMCPECSDKIYGEQDWYIRMKKNKK